MRILVIQGHPDPAGKHLCHALAEAYVRGARDGGHETRLLDVAHLNFPVLRTQADFKQGDVPGDIEAAQDDILWAGHLVFVYPLWLGTMPALLKAFIEQTFRQNFAMDVDPKHPGRWKKRLKGRSGRIVITMGMPAFWYRWYYGAHSMKNLERNILKFCGIHPVRNSLFGMVEAVNDEKRNRWLTKMAALGRSGD